MAEERGERRGVPWPQDKQSTFSPRGRFQNVALPPVFRSHSSLHLTVKLLFMYY